MVGILFLLLIFLSGQHLFQGLKVNGCKLDFPGSFRFTYIL